MEPVEAAANPWNPDRAWADPLIALLALIALYLSAVILQRRAVPAPLPRVGIQGRLAELPFAAEKVLGLKGALPLPAPDLGKVSRSLNEPWDRALAGVLAAEAGDLALGRRLARDPDLPGPAAADFRRCWDRAYEGGPRVDPGDRLRMRTTLGDGWAAGLLEARIEARDGGAGELAIQRAVARLGRRMRVLAGLGLAVFAACLAGIGTAIALLVIKRKQPPVLPAPACSGRALALLFLGWFLGLLLSGALMAPLLHGVPALLPYALPITYSLHAGWGLVLLRGALGRTWPGFRRGLWSGGGRPLGWGFGFLALAVPLVLAVSWLAGPLTRRFPPPQREMLEFLSGLTGAGPLLATALTVAVLAPLFEEILFRGVLLPFLARRWGWAAAILGSGLLFGAIHLQPAGLPTLATLGMVLGAAVRHTGSLRSAVLVHALWNGSVFLFLRTLVA